MCVRVALVKPENGKAWSAIANPTPWEVNDLVKKVVEASKVKTIYVKFIVEEDD